MKCLNCGNELPYVGGFCPFCGARVELDSPQPVQQVRDERRQQSALEPIAVEKPKAPQNSRQQRSLDPQIIEEKPKKKYSGVKIAAAIAVVVLVLVIGYFNIHIWKNVTCTAPKICVICGKTEGNPRVHDWAESRYTTTKCTLCQEVKNVPIAYRIEPSSGSEFGKLSSSRVTVKTEDGIKVSGRPYILNKPIENCVGLYIDFKAYRGDFTEKWGLWICNSDGKWEQISTISCGRGRNYVHFRSGVLLDVEEPFTLERYVLAPLQKGAASNYKMESKLEAAEVVN